MRRLAVLALVVFMFMSVAAFGAAYSDAACAAAPVAWTNDACAGRLWGLTNIQTPQAWSVTRGAGVTVAVIDTGVDLAHPDLAGNLTPKAGADLTRNNTYVCPWQKPPKRAKPSNAAGQDDHGHGTHVAGTIAAVAGNGIGVAGVAPDANILPVKVLNAEGSGSDSDVARGICFAADNGAKVINLSLGYDPVASILVQGLGNQTSDAIAYAYSKGVAVIIAAGNEGFPACDFPASSDKALCVGSVDRKDVKSWFSNFGQNIGVVAPGGIGSVFCHDDEDIWSTMLVASSLDCSDDGYETLAGTSMATPHVAAVAALIAAKYGALATPDFIYAKIKATADDLGAPGTDPIYGYGRVNALRAVTH